MRAALRAFAAGGLALLAGAAVAQPADPRRLAAEQVEEMQAFHAGTLGYLYGFAAVDMLQVMHKETRRITPGQQVLAPVNAFHRFGALVTPETAGSLRAPNADTLYLSGWFDLRAGPVVIRAPDTGGRYYTLAFTDLYNEVQHVGRRTTGTAARDFVLVGPGFEGRTPRGLTPVRVPTDIVWVLGRVMVRGADDLPAAAALLERFEALPLADWRRGHRHAAPSAEPPAAEAWAPLGSLEFFEVLNRRLRAQPPRPEDAALLAQFDLAGFGPRKVFEAAQATEPTRRGLQRAIEEARTMLRAASRRPLEDVRNGWIFPLALGRYGHDHLMRAAVAFGGYANLPEETVYAALTADAQGRPLTGDRRYRLRFAPGTRPPVGAFWSLSAYRLSDFSFMPNAAGIYSVGDHKPEFRTDPDGSFSIVVSREPPTASASGGIRGDNWLPVGDGPYSLVMRLYEPGPAVLDGRYAPPVIEAID